MAERLNKILYVEDDASIAEVAMMTLEDLGGFTVRHCSSGREALDALASYKPQLVLMDVMMPGMDGPEAMRNMKASPETRDIPVVFMTAKAQVHEQEAYRKLGAVGVVVKPFNPIELCETLESFWTLAQETPDSELKYG